MLLLKKRDVILRLMEAERQARELGDRIERLDGWQGNEYMNPGVSMPLVEAQISLHEAARAFVRAWEAVKTERRRQDQVDAEEIE